MTIDSGRTDPSVRPVSPSAPSPFPASSPAAHPPLDPSAALIPEQWAVDVSIRITELRGLKEVALAAPAPDDARARREAADTAIEELRKTDPPPPGARSASISELWRPDHTDMRTL